MNTSLTERCEDTREDSQKSVVMVPVIRYFALNSVPVCMAVVMEVYSTRL